MPHSTPMQPRPLGLLATVLKNRKTPHVPTPIHRVAALAAEPTISSSWTELLNLWEHAQYEVSGPHACAANAAPLLRDVLAQTDALVRAYGPRLEGLPADPAHFKLIVCGALLELGCLVSLTAGAVSLKAEPKLGTPFFLRAIGELSAVRGGPHHAAMELVRGRGILGIARERFMPLQSSSSSSSGESSLSSSSGAYPAPSSPRSLPVLPFRVPLLEDPLETLLTTALGHFDVALAAAGSTGPALGVHLADLVQRLAEGAADIGDKVKFEKWAWERYDDALRARPQGRLRLDAAVGRGRCGLSLASVVAERVEAALWEGEGDMPTQRDIEGAKGMLRQSIADFEIASTLGMALRPAWGPGEREEYDSHLAEACLTLANLLPAGAEQDDLYQKCGVELEDDGEDAIDD